MSPPHDYFLGARDHARMTAGKVWPLVMDAVLQRIFTTAAALWHGTISLMEKVLKKEEMSNEQTLFPNHCH